MTMLNDKHGTELVGAARQQVHYIRVINPDKMHPTPNSIEELRRAINTLPPEHAITARKVMAMTINAVAASIQEVTEHESYQLDTSWPKLHRTTIKLTPPTSKPLLTKQISTKRKPKRTPTMERNGVVCAAQQPFNNHAQRDGSYVNIAANPYQ